MSFFSASYLKERTPCVIIFIFKVVICSYFKIDLAEKAFRSFISLSFQKHNTLSGMVPNGSEDGTI